MSGPALLYLIKKFVYQTCNHQEYSLSMNKQSIGNALAGIIFLIVAVIDFTKDTSGIGVVFLIFAAVFLGLAFSGNKNK
jgi:hypothetical protein